MSVWAGLSLGESFAELSVSKAPFEASGAEAPARSRWQTARKSVSAGLQEAIDESARARGGTLVVSSWAAETQIARRLGSSIALVCDLGFETWLEAGLDSVTEAGFDAAAAIPRRSSDGASGWSPVRRDQRIGVGGRVRADGSIATPLDREATQAAAERIRTAGVGSVAVCFLHARKNPALEIEAAEILRAAGLRVVASHETPCAAESAPIGASPGETELERGWLTVLSAFVASSLADEEREIRSAFEPHADLWDVRWILADGRLEKTPSLESAFGLEAGLDLAHPGETIVHFGMERFFIGARDRSVRAGFPWIRALDRQPASPRALSSQPLARLRLDDSWAPSFAFETRGYEPGPVVFGKSLEPTVLDVLAWRGRVQAIDGLPSLSIERAGLRISETLLALDKSRSSSMRRPDIDAIGADLEALFVASLAADLLAAGIDGPMRATGPLAHAIAPLLAARTPKWAPRFDTSSAEWAASTSLLKLAIHSAAQEARA